MTTATSVTIRGKTYDTQAEAAADVGVSPSLVRYYSALGRLDEVGILPGIHDGMSHKITVHGKTYESQADCAADLGVSISAVSKALKRGRLDTLGEKAMLR